MIFEHTEVHGFIPAFRGMRNPLDSWSKSDTQIFDDGTFKIGDKDIQLANRLIAGGSEHRKFLRMIQIWVDITAPRYFWQEFDTYSIGVSKNSCSTMHKIMAYPFSLDMFQYDKNDDYTRLCLENIIKELERMRQLYLESKEEQERNKLLKTIKCILPESFLQKRTVNINYETLFNIIKQRKGHRLPEWNKEFMDWANALPLVKEMFEVRKIL